MSSRVNGVCWRGCKCCQKFSDCAKLSPSEYVTESIISRLQDDVHFTIRLIAWFGLRTSRDLAHYPLKLNPNTGDQKLRDLPGHWGFLSTSILSDSFCEAIKGYLCHGVSCSAFDLCRSYHRPRIRRNYLDLTPWRNHLSIDLWKALSLEL
jgi:hypothetical protein